MSRRRKKRNFKPRSTIAGCISLEDSPSPFREKRHHSNTLVGPDFTALENAIEFAANIGCKTIWITASDKWIPILKERVSGYIADPVYFWRPLAPNPRAERIYIPIFYVPHISKYADKRASVPWGYVNSAIYASRILGEMSPHYKPSSYMAIPTYRIIDKRYARAIRTRLFKMSIHKLKEANFHFSHNGESYLTGDYLPFTFDDNDLENIIDNAKSFHKGASYMVDGKKMYRQVADRRYINEMNLKDLFSVIKSSREIKLEESWDISSWSGYKKFFAEGPTLTRQRYDILTCQLEHLPKAESILEDKHAERVKLAQEYIKRHQLYKVNGIFRSRKRKAERRDKAANGTVDTNQ